MVVYKFANPLYLPRKLLATMFESNRRYDFPKDRLCPLRQANSRCKVCGTSGTTTELSLPHVKQIYSYKNHYISGTLAHLDTILPIKISSKSEFSDFKRIVKIFCIDKN